MTAVITGVGAVSAFGVGTSSLFNALAEGGSAVGPIRSFDASTFPTRVAGEAPIVSARAGSESLEVLDARWLAERLGALGIEHSAAARLADALEADGALRDRKLALGLLAAAE